MRYLTRQFAVGALRRGSGIEQLLSVGKVGGVAAVRWVSISPMDGQYQISLHTVQDLDDERFGDLSEFSSLDPVDEQYAGEGRELGRATDEHEAIVLAERLTDAAADRWVNFGMAGEEYLDTVRSRHTGSPDT